MKKLKAIMKGRLLKLFRFEILFALLRAVLLVPATRGLIRLSMKGAGVTHIASDNLTRVLLNPVTLLCGLLLLAIAMFFTLTDIAAVICCLHSEPEKKGWGAVDMLFEGARRALRLFKPGNWFLIPYTLVILPFTGLFSMTDIVSELHLPEFVQTSIMNTWYFLLPVTLIVIALTLFVLNTCLVFHKLILEDTDFFRGASESHRLLRGSRIRLVLHVIFNELLAGLLLMLIFVLIGAAGFGIIALCVPEALRHSAGIVVTGVLVSIYLYLTERMALPFAYAELSCCYTEQKERNGEPVPEPIRIRRFGKRRRLGAVAAVLALLIAYVGIELYGSGELAEAAGHDRRIEVQAHRGSSVDRPENSIPAYELAIEQGADWIELDVHQTSDGVVVITHDADLNRIAGINKQVWELTYDEIEQYDVGSWFSPEYSYLRVATLDEVLKLCKDRIKVNIELKPTGHEPDFEQHVIDVVRANGFENDCVLASLNRAAVERCYELAPDISTLYLMMYASGDMSEYTFAGGLSLEEGCVTSELVANIHRNGKYILAWTVNDPDNVETLVEAGVDGIITDDPVLIREAIREAENGEEIAEFVNIFFPATEASERLPEMDEGA